MGQCRRIKAIRAVSKVTDVVEGIGGVNGAVLVAAIDNIKDQHPAPTLPGQALCEQYRVP